jgi:hypothetical protein
MLSPFPQQPPHVLAQQVRAPIDPNCTPVVLTHTTTLPMMAISYTGTAGMGTHQSHLGTCCHLHHQPFHDGHLLIGVLLPTLTCP